MDAENVAGRNAEETLRRERQQNHQQDDDGVFRDLYDKAEVAPVALDDIHDERSDNRRQRREQQYPDDDHSVANRYGVKAPPSTRRRSPAQSADRAGAGHQAGCSCQS